MAACCHLAGITEPPRADRVVHKEECTVCFESQDSENGVLVCLHCFNGSCDNHGAIHTAAFGHHVYLRIRRTIKPKDPDEPDKKITKLAIGVEGGADGGEPDYVYSTSVCCLTCKAEDLPKEGNLPKIIDAVMAADTMTKREQLKAWELQPQPCEHTLCLQQAPVALAEKSRAKCTSCELCDNLWLCLVCGHLGCGRLQYGAGGQKMGGNEHALTHATTSGHGVAVKMGTITPAGTADLWCYLCDDGPTDPELAAHLAAFGIDVATEEKTAKSTQEMALEGSLNLLQGPGADGGLPLTPAYGPGLTGMANLGNSCYLNSVCQVLFSIPAFAQRYHDPSDAHVRTCTNANPATCFRCQMGKLAGGLLSGKYSQPKSTDEGQAAAGRQDGIKPAMFKSFIGSGHPEFSTGRMQDALEFLQHVLKIIEQNERTGGEDPCRTFAFQTESRLECTRCHRVRYTSGKESALQLPIPAVPTPGADEPKPVVPLAECLKGYFAPEHIPGFNCPNCASAQIAAKQWRFETFPEYLLLALRRETFVDWVPKKLDTAVDAPERLALDPSWTGGGGAKPGEETLPEEAAAPLVNAEALAQLMGMGFDEVPCTKALLATGNSGAEVAAAWLFEHMDDPDLHTPLPRAASGGGGGSTANPADIETLCGMGFSPAQARKALKETDGNVERAVDWLFSHTDDPMDEDEDAAPAAASSLGRPTAPAGYELHAFVWHKGGSVQSGHYVAFIKIGGKWTQFNDDHVGVAVDCREARQGAYFFIYRAV